MKMYRTTQLLTVGHGTVLQLSEEQLKDRVHQVEPLGEGRYQAKALMQFKRGEVLGLEGELARSQRDLVEEVAAAGGRPFVQTSAQQNGQAGSQNQAGDTKTDEKKAGENGQSKRKAAPKGKVSGKK